MNNRISEQLIKLFNVVATKIENDEHLKDEKQFVKDVVTEFVDFDEVINSNRSKNELTEEEWKMYKRLIWIER